MIKDLPPEHRKFKRSKAGNEVGHSISSETVECAKMLAAIESIKGNAKQICEGMAACFELHKLMLIEKKNALDILNVFPHFMSYDGLLVRVKCKLIL